MTRKNRTIRGQGECVFVLFRSLSHTTTAILLVCMYKIELFYYCVFCFCCLLYLIFIFAKSQRFFVCVVFCCFLILRNYFCLLMIYFLPCHVVCCFLLSHIFACLLLIYCNVCLFAGIFTATHVSVCLLGSVKKEDASMLGSVQRQVKKACVCVLFSRAYCFTLFVVVC